MSDGGTSKRIWILVAALRKYVQSLRQAIHEPSGLDVGFLTAAQLGGAALGFASATAAARVLGPTKYGIAALVMAYPNLLQSFLSVKSMSITTRYVATFRDSNQYSHLQWVCRLGYRLDLLISALVLALVGATTWWVSPRVLDAPDLSWLVLAFAASFPLASLKGTSKAVLSSWGEFRWIATLELCERAFILVLVVSFLLAGWGPQGLVLATAFGSAVAGIAAVCSATYVLRRDGVKLWGKANQRELPSLRKEMVRLFSWNYLLTTFSGIVENGPILLLGYLRGAGEAGFLRLAAILIVTMSYVEEALKRVTYPILAVRLYSQPRSSIKSVLQRWTRYAGIPLMLVTLLALPLAPLLVPRVFGESYSPMTPGLQIMTLSVAVSALLFWRNPYYFASGKVRELAQAFGVYALVVTILCWTVVDRWGFLGVAGLLTTGNVLVALFLARTAWNQLVTDDPDGRQ